jgi:hypothetical protein
VFFANFVKSTSLALPNGGRLWHLGWRLHFQYQTCQRPHSSPSRQQWFIKRILELIFELRTLETALLDVSRWTSKSINEPNVSLFEMLHHNVSAP